MSNKIKGLTVALEGDWSEEGIQPLVDAIKCFRGVQDVTLTESGMDHWHATTEAKRQLQEVIGNLLWGK